MLKRNRDNFNENYRKLYTKFQCENSFLFIGDEPKEMLSAIKNVAALLKVKVISLDIQAAGELLFHEETVIVTEGRDVPFVYKEKPYWAKEMQQHPDDKFILVFEHFEAATPRMKNWIKRLAQDQNYDGQDIGEFFVAALYTPQSADEDVEKTIGSAICSPFRPSIKWNGENKNDFSEFVEYYLS